MSKSTANALKTIEERRKKEQERRNTNNQTKKTVGTTNNPNKTSKPSVVSSGGRETSTKTELSSKNALETIRKRRGVESGANYSSAPNSPYTDRKSESTSIQFVKHDADYWEKRYYEEMERIKAEHAYDPAYPVAAHAIEIVDEEREREEYLLKYQDKKYKDDFWGQFAANYRAGDISERSIEAVSDYLKSGNKADYEYAEKLDILAENIQKNNKDVYADDATLPQISQDFAGYLPQLLNRTAPLAVGGGIGGTVGAVAGALATAETGGFGAVPAAKWGAKIGATIASGTDSYDSMKASAFKGLVELGADEETARAAANDEAVLGAITEMGDTWITLSKFGYGAVLNLIGKGAVKETAKSGLKKVGGLLAKYGLNIEQERAEEGIQGAISVANKRRVYGDITRKADEEIGQYGKGNIDLYNRPIYKNADGTLSTVDSITVQIDDKFIVLPSIVRDENGNAKRLDKTEDIVAYYVKTGEYLGEFDTLEEANAYAQKLHNAQAYKYSDEKNEYTNDGLWGLTKDAGKVLVGVDFGTEDEETINEINEQKRVGGVIAAIMGLPGTAFDVGATSYIESQNAKSRKVVDAVIKSGLETNSESEAHKKAEAVKAKRDAGETISKEELVEVAVATEQEKRATQPDSLEQAAMDVVASRNATQTENIQPISEISATGDSYPTQAGGYLKAPKNTQRSTTKGMTLTERLEAQSQNNETLAVEDVKKATAFGDEGSKLVTRLANSQGVTFSQAERAVKIAYNAGFTDLKATDVNFDNRVQKAAFDAGKIDRGVQDRVAQANAKNATIYETGFTENEYSAKLTADEREMFTTMSKDLKMDTSFVDKIVAFYVNGKAQEANASHLDGKMEVSSTSQKPMVAIATHEGGHRMKQLAPTEFGVLMDALYKRSMRENAKASRSQTAGFDNIKSDYNQADTTMGTLDYFEEFAVRELETIFSSAEEFNKWRAELDLNPQAKSAWEKFIEIIKKVWEDMWAAVTNSKMSLEAKRQAQTELELFANAYRGAIKAAETRANETQTKNSDTNSAKNLEIKINEEYNGNTSYALKSKYNEYNTIGMQWAYDSHTQIGDLNVLYNKFTGKYVLVKATKEDVGFIELRAGTLAQMRKEREYYATEKDRLDGSEETVDKVLRDSGFGRNDNDGDNVDVGNGRTGKQNAELLEGKSNSNKTTDTQTTDGNLTEGKNFSLKDSEYLELAKAPKKNEAKLSKMVEEAAKEAGYIGTYYHGSRSDFTIFKKERGGASNSNANIGFWFTESEEGAKKWADESWWGDGEESKVYKTYLRLNNPKVYETVDTKAQRDELYKGYEGIDKEMSLYDSIYYFEDGRRYHAERYDYDDSKRRRSGFAEWDAFKAIVKKYDADTIDYYLSKVSESEREIVKQDAERYLELSQERKALEKQMTELRYSDAYELFRTDMYKQIGLGAEDANIGGTGKYVENKDEMLKKYVDMLKQEEYDGVVIKNTDYDTRFFGENNNQYLVFDSNQVKSAEPVTYDDNGNVIPLSERFNKGNDDIRYSLKDSEGNTLSEEQQEYFKDSKVRDENGNLKVVYHGTSKGGFTVFDTYAYYAKFGLFGNGAYFTDSKDIAEQYTRKGKGKNPQVYSAYLNITNPIDMDGKANIEAWNKALQKTGEDFELLKGEITNEQAFKSMVEDLEYAEIYSYDAAEIVRNVFENMGYDGITHIGGGRVNQSDGTKHRVFIAFEQEQIKDVNNTKPTSNPDIRFSLKSEESTAIDNVGMQFDSNSKSVAPQFSLKTWNASQYVQDRETAIKAIMRATGVSKKDAERYINNINSIARMIADDRTRLDYESNIDENASALKTNKEYKWTVDMSTLCAKRLLFTGTFDAIQKAMPNTAFNSEDIVALRSMMMERGYEVACGICYVESTRRELGTITAEFIERYKLSQKTGKAMTYVNSKGVVKELTKSQEMLEKSADKTTSKFVADKNYTPTLAELNTTDIDLVKKEHPLVYEAYVSFMKARGQATPKLLETRTEYKGEILKHFNSKTAVKSRNDAGGLRVQSFSDFEVAHLIDMMQIVLDMSQVGLMSQAYTKVPAFADVFGNTGMKINLSLIAKESGLDKNGNLIFDDVEGMPHEEAFRLRDKYSKNVGTILVGKNDAHIKAALADPRIDFVIPYHKSFWKESLYEALGLEGYKNYEAWQNEKPLDKGRKIKNFQPSEYWDYTKSGEENAKVYLEMCLRDRRIPKFQQFKNCEGYWKLLIDFKMYDNKGVGSPQMVVSPEFAMDEAMSILNAYEGGHRTFPVAQDVVDDFIEQYKNKSLSLKGGLSDSEIRNALANDKLSKYVDSGIISTEKYNELTKIYGAIHTGERPSRDIQVPRKSGKNKKVSQTIRTVLEAQATPDEAVPTIERMVEDGVFSYDVYTDKQAINDAESYIKEYGWDESLEDWFDAVEKGEVSKELTTMGWALYNNAANIAATTTSETERTTAIKTSLRILDAMVRHQRSAAQALQATRILKKLSPETQLYGVQKSVSALQNELTERYGDKAPELKIDEGLAEQFLNAKTPEERAEVEEKIYKDIGRQMPSRFIDKWNAWRYLAMLGNVRTHIRNLFGNAGFAPVVGVKNLTATAIESVVNRVSNKKMVRGKAIIIGNKADRALLKAAWNDYGNVADMISNGGKYNDSAMANKNIQDGRQIFKFKPLEWARKKNSELLEREDILFSKPHYSYALAQYCKANNITAEQIKRGKAIAPARDYAIKEAQKATYRDTNAFSQMVSEWGRGNKNEKNVVKKAFNTVIEGILPFRKTPANILARGVEYSPIGLLKGLSYDLMQVSKGKMTATEAIDNISAGLTGTGLLALGVYLAAEGLIRGHGEDEEDEKKFKEMMGHQAYSLELPNGQSITLDWLAPEALPFFVGVNLWETTKGSEEDASLSAVLQSVSHITEPMLEMSCLQGLNDLFEGIGYASSNDTSGLVSIVSSAVTSYLTQGLPTILGQAERTGEENRMTTYTEKDDFLTGDMQYTLGKASAKIPFVDYHQIPYIDAWGRKEASGMALKRGFNNFLNPAYTSTVETSKMEEELLRLYEQTGEGGVFPERADKYFTVNGVRKDLTAEEYVRYATLKGEKSYRLVSDLVNSTAYSKLSDEEKAKAVREAYDYANQKAKQSISNYKPETWVEKADEFGANVGNYISFKTEVSGTKEENGGKISKQEVVDIILDTAQNDSETWKMYLSMYDGDKDMYAYNEGIEGETYMYFLESLNDVDEPTENGKYGTYTQKEAERAVNRLDGLSRREKAILYQSVNPSWKKNPFR